MIEINLIPDVKYELLKARRMRASVISLSILVAIIAAGVVTLLTVYVVGVQSGLKWVAGTSIEREYEELRKVENLSETLTIQNQLSQLSSLQADKTQSSRLLDLVTTIAPTGENKVAISTLELDTDDGVITMEAEAENGYEALEVFKKTVAASKFEYSETDDNSCQADKSCPSVDVASNIIDGERSYGENSSGKRVLRFILSFEYPEELFSTTIFHGRIAAPTKKNATDSTLGIPKGLFTTRVEDDKGSE